MMGVVYQDLKPENVLVREDGHIMLSDFDLSLRCYVNPTLVKSSEPSRRNSTYCIQPACIEPTCKLPVCVEPSCLQPSCFVPRLFQSRTKKGKKKNEAGHGSAVDWWTFGIFLYELLHGRTPFRGSGNRETLSNVVNKPLKLKSELIPLHLPPGDTSTERNLYIDGSQEQIEAAKQLVNEVISEALQVVHENCTGCVVLSIAGCVVLRIAGCVELAGAVHFSCVC